MRLDRVSGGRLNAIAFTAGFALAISGCTGTGPGSDPNGVELPKTTAIAAPKTLEAATAAAQEKNDRHSSGDFAGEWYLFTNQLRDALTQDSFVEYSKTCAKIGPLVKATGVRMESDDSAIVRLEVFGIMQSRTMVYEENAWYMAPGEFLTEHMGLTGDQLVEADKAEGGCPG